jgi:hypothetical protein
MWFSERNTNAAPGQPVPQKVSSPSTVRRVAPALSRIRKFGLKSAAREGLPSTWMTSLSPAVAVKLKVSRSPVVVTAPVTTEPMVKALAVGIVSFGSVSVLGAPEVRSRKRV